MNNINVVSLFSGAGGSSIGYKMAGATVLLANEFIKEAREVYTLNNPTTIVDDRDIRSITGNDILAQIGLKKYELDILDGSPPCSSFSINGARDKNWGKINNYSSTKQRTDDLFDEYLRILEETMPKVFIAENVKGLSMGKAKDYLHYIIKKASSIGYNVEYRVLNASDYSVPQDRERVIIQGIRNDLNQVPHFPVAHDKKISCEDAIGHLINMKEDMTMNEDIKRVKYMRKYFRPLCNNKDIKDIAEKYNLKVYQQSFRRDRWNKPYYTIKQHHTRPFHPTEDRYMTAEEAKILMSFPSEFKFVDHHSPTRNWERMGRAVPPLLMKAIAEEVIDKVLNV
jgi:DNA (cytosine-5)-methyltransferase 1